MAAGPPPPAGERAGGGGVDQFGRGRRGARGQRRRQLLASSNDASDMEGGKGGETCYVGVACVLDHVLGVVVSM